MHFHFENIMLIVHTIHLSLFLSLSEASYHGQMATSVPEGTKAFMEDVTDSFDLFSI